MLRGILEKCQGIKEDENVSVMPDIDTAVNVSILFVSISTFYLYPLQQLMLSGHMYTLMLLLWKIGGILFSVCQFKIRLHIDMVKVKALYQITVKMIYIKVKGQIFCKNDLVLVSDVDSETHQYPV